MPFGIQQKIQIIIWAFESLKSPERTIVNSDEKSLYK